jgi:hypothetical protein
MIPLWKGKNPIYFGVKGQGHCYYKYNFWQQDRFRTITLVLYIGSLPNLATWFPCVRGRTLFILGSLPLYRLIIYIDGRILWCTQFLFDVLYNIFLFYEMKMIHCTCICINTTFNNISGHSSVFLLGGPAASDWQLLFITYNSCIKITPCHRWESKWQNHIKKLCIYFLFF